MSLNVALYGERRRWTMTERGKGTIRRSEREYVVGPSSLEWNGATLTIRIDEVGMPIPQRVKGVVRVHPRALTGHVETLETSGNHVWTPIAPSCRIEVELERPSLRWSGEAYLDANRGDVPLEKGFTRWDWGRAHRPDGAAIVYDTTLRSGATHALALKVDAQGRVERFEAPPPRPLPATLWRVQRLARGDAGTPIEIVRSLEDTPFYARTELRARLHGEPVHWFHESVSLDRFTAPIVQMMLPFRMPRRRG